MSSASRIATSSGRGRLGPGFTRAFREELARVEEKQSCCRLAAVAGLMHTAGSFLIHGGSTEAERYEIRIGTTVQAGAKLAYSVFKGYGAEGELVTRREPRFQHRLVYEVHLRGTPAALQALNEMGVLSDSFELEPGISRRLVKKSCCRSAFMRGCLIGAGSANAPQREAHLEILTPHEAFASDLVRLLSNLEFHAGMRYRRGSYVVYLKGRDEVAGLLALAGAHEAALQVEEQSVMREVRSRANRLANCDYANLRRTSAAASASSWRPSPRWSERAAWKHLPVALRDMADLRLQYPYLNLAELAEAGGRGPHPFGRQPPPSPPRGGRRTGGRQGRLMLVCRRATGRDRAHELTGDSAPQEECSSMSTKIAINGFGRIGRLLLRAIAKRGADLEVVAVNDLTDAATLAHLLKYDSVHGVWPGDGRAHRGQPRLRGQDHQGALHRPTSRLLPWRELGVDVVLECTGHYTDRAGAGKHLDQGARKVDHQRAGQRPGPHRGHGRQRRRVRPVAAPHHLQRVVHHQLPGAGLQGAGGLVRHRAGLHDHRPRLHQRPAHPGPAAQGPAAGPGGRALRHPHVHRRGPGHRPGHPGAQGQARRLRPAGAGAGRLGGGPRP